MTKESEEEFDKAWNNNKVTFANESVLKYFEQRLIPAFKEHSSIWKLREMGVSDPENGLTNNPSESMNAILHSLQQWKQVPLDVICVSLFHLSCYYQHEITRAHHLCGTWHLKEEFPHLQRDASLMPFLPKTIDPKEIVTKAREYTLESFKENCNTNSDAVLTDDPPSTRLVNTKQKPKGSSQLALAQEVLSDNRVTLTDNGCWIVRGTDNETPYAVRLFPKEFCSCPAIKMCYHIIACKLKIGQDVDENTKPNMTMLSQKIRRKNKEKPSGRKCPRKKDFNCVSKSISNG